METKILTVFTPTYNRLKTIKRTYESILNQSLKEVDWLIIDDGSKDGLREWVKSLGRIIISKGIAYDWMGLPKDEITEDHFIVDAQSVCIEYIYKPNGGLYTGYNVAFDVIKTELCMCVDSDDYLPDNAVELIVNKWGKLSPFQRQRVGGIAGLDYNVLDKKPIGGLFRIESEIDYVLNLGHIGDCKYVFQTELIKRYSPQIGFEGEKDFNPHYIQMQLFDEYPMVVINENLCWVEYQYGIDSMSQNIYKQYIRSPRSFAEYRLKELKLKRGNNIINKCRLCAHYVSSCFFSNDKDWLKKSPYKLITLLTAPLGYLISLYIRYKASQD